MLSLLSRRAMSEQIETSLLSTRKELRGFITHDFMPDDMNNKQKNTLYENSVEIGTVEV